MDLLTQKKQKEFSKISKIDINNADFKELFKEWLIEKSLKQIQIDIRNWDVESIEGLLKHCGNSVLANYLPEN